MRWGLLFFPSFFCELICHFVSPNAGVCWYPLKNYIGSLSEGVDVLCELLLRCVRLHLEECATSEVRVCGTKGTSYSLA